MLARPSSGRRRRRYPPSERWIGDLIDRLKDAVTHALKPCDTYLACFAQWEDFLNLDVDDYVAALKHVTPNDEDVEEGQEPDAPPVSVNLNLLKQVLEYHKEEKVKVEAAIPAEPMAAGICVLNAGGLRAELAQKHLGIMQRILGVHAEHVGAFVLLCS